MISKVSIPSICTQWDHQADLNCVWCEIFSIFSVIGVRLLTFFSLYFGVDRLFVCNVDSRWCVAFCQHMHPNTRMYVGKTHVCSILSTAIYLSLLVSCLPSQTSTIICFQYTVQIVCLFARNISDSNTNKLEHLKWGIYF